MYRPLLALAVFTLFIGATRVNAAEPQFAHMVFFTLAEDDEQNCKQLIDACQKYLSDHDGTVYFSVGSRAKELDREVNDQKFDVALHMVFADKSFHDKYQTDPRHLKFIEENKQLWSNVRVFDSYLAGKSSDEDEDKGSE